MKKYLLLTLSLVAVMNFGYAQNEEEELPKAPGDFLDLFDSSRRDKEMVRTNTKFVWQVGWNQAVGNGNGIGEDYRFWGSGVFGFGVEFSTRLMEEDDLLRFNYGLSTRYQSLRFSDDSSRFATRNNITDVEFIGPVDRSRFSQTSLILPLHLEIGRRDLKEYRDGIKRYGGSRPFVFGIGGYAGLHIQASQEIEFDREGRDVTQTIEGDFEMTDFQYGLSAYAGWNHLQIFATYGLNDIFDNSPIQQQYLTFGFRFR